MSRIVLLGRIPDVGLELLDRNGEMWAWSDDDHITCEAIVRGYLIEEGGR